MVQLVGRVVNFEIIFRSSGLRVYYVHTYKKKEFDLFYSAYVVWFLSKRRDFEFIYFSSLLYFKSRGTFPKEKRKNIYVYIKICPIYVYEKIRKNYNNNLLKKVFHPLCLCMCVYIIPCTHFKSRLFNDEGKKFYIFYATLRFIRKNKWKYHELPFHYIISLTFYIVNKIRNDSEQQKKRKFIKRT